MWIVPRAHLALELIGAEERHHHGQQIHRGDDASMILVERYAAPVHAAEVAGREERAAGIGRREDPFVAQRRDEPAAFGPVPEGESPGIISEHGTLRRERRK